MIKKVFALFFLCSLWQMSFAQSAKTIWVDSVFRELKSGGKIAQLFLVPISGDADDKTINEIENLVQSHEIGGLIFKNINPHRQAQLINHFQSIASVPLLIAQEGNINTLLDSAMVYPSSLVLGAIRNDSLIYQFGAQLAKQLKMIGVNVLFSPSLQITGQGIDASPETNSFGQDKNDVARKSLALMRGLQDNGILACAQYSPLKGITVVDVRNGMPVVDFTADTLQQFPFKALVEKGLKGISPSAAQFPIFYKDVNAAKKHSFSSVTLSSLYTAEWLKKTSEFQGLIFVDIGKIENINSKQKPGDVELIAFQNGNDVLMNPEEIAPAIRKIKKLLRKEDDYESQLENTVKKILATKFDAGLWSTPALNTDNLMSRLISQEAKLLNQKLFEAATTVLRNEGGAIPIKILEGRKFAYVSSFSSEKNYTFYNYLKKYADITFQTIEDKTDENVLKKSLATNQVIVVGIFPETTLATIKKLDKIFQEIKTKPQIILCDFGNPFVWSMANKYQALLTAHAENPETLRIVPQVLFGALPAAGKMPYTPSVLIPMGTGLELPSLNRLAYSIPEDAQMSSLVLTGIDSIAKEAMRIGATPGCQVFVARKGKVIYEKNFGSYTYDSGALPVTDETIYDLASITKVSATLQTAMFMHERGLRDLNKKVSYYLPELKGTNKKDITVMDMLTHQSGLVPFIPMYPQTMKDTTHLPYYYSRVKNEKYPLQVGANLFAAPILKDSVWSWILKSRMADKPSRTPYSYKYSDLGFLILQHMAENLLNQPMDEFLSQNLYEPLGATSTGFNPLNRFQKQSIAPTEDDKIYRKSFVSGTVHDERAAMLGGVAGHAGLFSNANDLGKLGQMLLQEGEYGGIRYYKPETIRLFTAKKFKNSRRGIGWDKPIPSDPGTLTSFYASPSTYGHTGFTGTCIWIDPEFDLVYIFLSNRVYPDRNNKLSNANIRSRIQDVIYKSIFGYVELEKPGYIVNDFAINTGASRQ